MKIVRLDSATLGGADLNLSNESGDFVNYELTPKDKVIGRLKNADVAMVNKVILDENVLKNTNLKLILETATGFNNINLDYAKKQGIIVKNVAGYSTRSVVQHTFALVFAFLNQTIFYNGWVKEGKWCESGTFTDFTQMLSDLSGKKHDIIGFGAIGKEVARISSAFGARVCYCFTSGANHNAEHEKIKLNELLKTCDIISIHAPLSDKTKNLLSYKELILLGNKAILINVGRGGIINEADLAKALDEKNFRVGLDVLENEPMPKNHPLLSVKNRKNLLITPHIAWVSKESLATLTQKVYENLKEWVENGK